MPPWLQNTLPTPRCRALVKAREAAEAEGEGSLYEREQRGTLMSLERERSRLL
jgi:hypothetical protein